MTDEDVAEELRRRAERLAVVDAPSDPEIRVEMLVFRWDGSGYAVATSHLRETVEGVTVTAVPAAPPALIGAAAVRSIVVPVIDVRPLLDLPTTRRPVSRLVVLEEGDRPSVALAADELVDIAGVPTSGLKLPNDRPAIVRAVLPTGTALLDADALLDLPPFFPASEGPHP